MVVLMQASAGLPYHIAHTQRGFRACVPSVIQSVYMWTVSPTSMEDGREGIGSCCVSVRQGTLNMHSVPSRPV
jgi:hypothetical protein